MKTICKIASGIHFQAPDSRWVMKITPDRKIVINEDVEVSEAAMKLINIVNDMTKPKEWQSLTHEEFVAIAKSIWGDNLGMSDGFGYTVAWASSYATIEPSSKMLLLYHAIDKALREKNNG
jgi:hypothetical protein